MANRDPEHVVDCEVLCECASKRCLEQIPVTLDEYETVRREAAHSFVLPGHQVRTIDRVVEQTDGYVVVRRSPTTPLWTPTFCGPTSDDRPAAPAALPS